MVDREETNHCRPACTAYKDHICQISKWLPNCNEVLFDIGMELREQCGCSLSLVSFQPYQADVIPPPGPDLNRAKTFFRWLLRTHICITGLELIYKWVNVHTQAVLEELPENSRLKKLKVYFAWDANADTRITSLLPRLRCLEELDCYMSNPTDALVAAVSSLLRNTTCLTSLVFHGVFENGQPPKSFIDALAANSTLKSFELWANWNTDEPPGCLGEYVRSNRLLTKLTLFGEQTDRDGLFLDEALVRNCTLTVLVIGRLCGGERTVRFLTRVLAECAAIRKLTFGGVLNQNNTIYEATLSRCGEALAENVTLEELTLPYSLWHPTNWISFFAFLEKNKHLIKLKVSTDWLRDYRTFPPVLEALTKRNSMERVSFNEYRHGARVNLMHFRAFTTIQILGRVSAKLNALRRLPELDHFTCIIIGIFEADRRLFTALAKYIRATTILRELRICVTEPAIAASTSWWALLLESISANTSIGYISISSGDNLVCNGRLAITVGLSRYITRVFYIQSRREWDPATFIIPLSDAIRDNYNLLQVDLCVAKVGAEATRCLFTIRETIRRNTCLLERAAAFNQTTALDRDTAAALEKVSRRSALVRELAEKEGIAESEVARMVRSRLRSVDGLHDYMRLTGVVKECVTCAPPVEDGSTQLHDLNTDCWRVLRRYLSFDDVTCFTVERPDKLTPS